MTHTKGAFPAVVQCLILITISLILNPTSIVTSEQTITTLSAESDSAPQFGKSIQFSEHTDIINEIVFSSDSSLLASTSRDNSIKIWTTTVDQSILNIDVQPNEAKALDFNIDGTSLASGHSDGSVTIWNAATGERVHNFTTSSQNDVNSLSYSSNGKLLAIGLQAGFVEIWSTETWQRTKSLILHGTDGAVTSVEFAQDDSQLIAGFTDMSAAGGAITIAIWNTSDWTTMAGFETYRSVWSLALHPTEPLLASGGTMGELNIWNTQTLEIHQSVKISETNSVISLDFSPDGDLLVAALNGGSVHIYDRMNESIFSIDVKQSQHFPDDGQNVLYSPDGVNIATFYTSSITLWSIDRDGDGVPDISDSFPLDLTESADTDGDGVGDNADDFPNDSTEWLDFDGDGVGDNADLDDDGDGYSDLDESTNCGEGTNPLNASDTPTDTDGDLTCDLIDDFPNDSTEQKDTDGDGTGDNADVFPNYPKEHVDRDGDGVGDNSDAFPDDQSQWIDSDGDGMGDNRTGNNSDSMPYDFDNDGCVDPIDLNNVKIGEDFFWEDSSECSDFDGDGVGDNVDLDDDNDGVTDTAELIAGTSPFNSEETPTVSFEFILPGTAIGLGAWDLIGIFIGIPFACWMAFGVLTRGQREEKFARRLHESSSEDELALVVEEYERALMWRTIGPHQSLRLERIRGEVKERIRVNNSSIDSLGDNLD